MSFKFLKSIDLGTIRKDLGDIPSRFGWEITVWKPTVEQPRAEGELCLWGFANLGTGSETVHEFGGIETGIEPVSDVGSEPLGPHVVEDFLESSFDDFDRVADVVSNDEPKTPSEPIQPPTFNRRKG